MNKLQEWALEKASGLAHQYKLQYFKLQNIPLLKPGTGETKRIMAIACWNFPIYSQNFVYQEMTQLIHNGYDVRFGHFVYDKQCALPEQFKPLKRSIFRIIGHPKIGKQNFIYFQNKYPEKVQSIINLISSESGMSEDQLIHFDNFLHAFTFARLAESYRPHYLHSYFFYEGTLFTLVASYLLGIPRGVSCYADHLLEDYPLKLVRLHIEQCEIIIATSQRIKNELLSISENSDPNKILVKPNAINCKAFPAVTSRNEPGPDNSFRVLTVCRIEPKKGLHFLVEAFQILQEKGVRNISLHILGGVDNNTESMLFAEQLKSLISDNNLASTVFLEGIKTESEIREYFSNSHLFVAPFVETDSGDKDGIPTSLLEAMAAGIPIIATDAGSITEVVENNLDAVIVPQKDKYALAESIASLKDNRKQRTILGENAAKKVRDKFDVTVCEKLFHSTLSHLLD